MIDEYSTETLFKLSKEKGIPLPQVYKLYAKEWVINQIIHCEQRDEIGFQRSYLLDPCKEGNYQEPELFLAIGYGEVPKAFTKEVIVDLDKLKIPVKVKVQGGETDSSSFQKKKISSVISEGSFYEISIYEPEQELAECLLKCIRYQNLQQDLSCYDDIFQILTGYVISGRSVTARLENLLNKENYKPTEQSMKELLRLKQSKQMERKWNRYLKAFRRNRPEWTEVMDLLTRFYEGIWDTLLQDQIFLGDWMPEIRRFL